MTTAAVAVATVLAVAGAMMACTSPSPPTPAHGALGGDVARIGDVTLGVSLVRQVARERDIPPGAALDALVEDALAAEGARAQGLDREVTWDSTAALAHVAARRLGEAARDQGSPTDDELAELQVVHAVVLRTASLPEATALFVANAIADAVATARNSTEFQQRAQAASKAARTSIEALPPFDASGSTDDGKLLDPDFTAAAFALHRVGETSPIIETSFGWHVIRLLSRELPTEANREERRAALLGAVISLRARGRLTQQLRVQREHTHVEVSGAADELMARLTASP